MAKAKTTETVETVETPVYPIITMPYVTDWVLAQVEGTFSPEALNERSKYVDYNGERGFFTRNV